MGYVIAILCIFLGFGLIVPVLEQKSRELSEPSVRLVIPDDKKEEAAAYTLKLVEQMKGKAYNPEAIYQSATDQALRLYGVPAEQKVEK